MNEGALWTCFSWSSAFKRTLLGKSNASALGINRTGSLPLFACAFAQADILVRRIQSGIQARSAPGLCQTKRLPRDLSRSFTKLRPLANTRCACRQFSSSEASRATGEVSRGAESVRATLTSLIHPRT
ncbi:uncharacterized protein SCHCODRAFT_02179469 [Schizophyllum commune H4-8]|uniref:uncharacterized protein n=1 Tax=Schizophyllum commune (strain H4-8 / FGSC 9210) TaxID=578458 RepID=UPI002160AE1B|nr:uncharacterized protein SCHCODRAFT_02179469 [Schizophyllum commune H4-8]KAI5836584.1 hypothetical protein SCHCODRAFT_02179469 [Schizophyllum commune H4-8]